MINFNDKLYFYILTENWEDWEDIHNHNKLISLVKAGESVEKAIWDAWCESYDDDGYKLNELFIKLVIVSNNNNLTLIDANSWKCNDDYEIIADILEPKDTTYYPCYTNDGIEYVDKHDARMKNMKPLNEYAMLYGYMFRE